MQTEYNTVKDEEDSLKLRVCNELNLNLHNETYRQSWLDNRHYDLGKLILEKNLKLDQLKQDLWENNIDKSLNQEDYWVPNKDVLSIKDRIKGLGIKVNWHGVLSYLDEDEKTRIVRISVYNTRSCNRQYWGLELLKEIFKKIYFAFISSYIYPFSHGRKGGIRLSNSRW